MTQIAVVGDGLAGHLIVQRLRESAANVVWYGDRAPTLPPVALLHRHVGRSFENDGPERAAWRAADEWAAALSQDVCRSVTMLRPTSNDSRLSSTFDRLDLPHVSEVDVTDYPFLKPCMRLFRYEDAYTVDLEGWMKRTRSLPDRSRLVSLERREGWRLTDIDGTTDDVAFVIFATGPATADWFDGLDLNARPGELAVVERPDELPPGVAVSRNGHVGCDPSGRYACAGATYRSDSAQPRGRAETVTDCLDGIARSVPALAEATPVQGWFGVRAVVHPDRRPLAGPTSEPGVWLAAGLASKGLLWGARVAEIVCDGVLDGVDAPAATDPRRFGPVRLRQSAN